MVGFSLAWQTFSPINPTANPGLISPDDRTPKAIIVAKTAFAFGETTKMKRPKPYSEPVAQWGFELDSINPAPTLYLWSLYTPGIVFCMSNNIFWLEPLPSDLWSAKTYSAWQ